VKSIQRKIIFFFISDIRTADHRKMSDKENELRVIADQKSQKRWVEILKAKNSMLKFRLPYYPGELEYLKGIIYLPVWGPQSTTETRLVVDNNNELRTYDHTEYEEQMFHFNTVTRSMAHAHDVKANGLDYCYDCRAEVHILSEYLLKYPDHWIDSTDARDLFDEIYGNEQKKSFLEMQGLHLEEHPASQGEWYTAEDYAQQEIHPAAVKTAEDELRRSFLLAITKMSQEISPQCSLTGRTLETFVGAGEKETWDFRSNLSKLLPSLPKSLAPSELEY